MESYNMEEPQPLVLIVGSGFGGVGLGVKLAKRGIPFRILEKQSAIGGTWNANRYPGASCDVESPIYCYSFERTPTWSASHIPASEIADYIEMVAKKYQVFPHIEFNTTVHGAIYNRETALWTVQIESNSTGGEASVTEFKVPFLVSATGQLSSPRFPEYPGMDTFQGDAFHTAEWDHSVDLDGKRVAIIGTGPSAIQVAPAIVGKVSHLSVFQRSPAWFIPKWVHKYSAPEKALMKYIPGLKHVVKSAYNIRYEAIMMLSPTVAYKGIRWFYEGGHRRKLKKLFPNDKELRDKLTPDYPILCKRGALSSEFLPIFKQEHVSLITEPIQSVEPTGIKFGDKVENYDVIVWATGFHATKFGTAFPIQIQGKRETLGEEWAKDAARAYVGTSVKDYPNLFFLYGPNSNFTAGAIVTALEHSSTMIADAIRALVTPKGKWRSKNRQIVVRPGVHDAYNKRIQKSLEKAPTSAGCSNWYVNEKGHNANNFPYSMHSFKRNSEFKRADYRLSKVPNSDLPMAAPVSVQME